MLLDKLEEIENKYDELTKILSDPEIFSDYTKSQ
jgi:protein subunit release factor A